LNQRLLLSGDEAIAHGAKAAGVRFAAAYPGTPSTEIMETFARFPGSHAQWSPNEKVAFEVGIGASLAGARTLVCMKHVGVNVAADPLMTFAYTGVKGGFVLVSADDPEMHSSQNEQDNRTWAKFAKIPMLEPSDSQECYDFTGLALDLSEQFDAPVLLRITTRIAHSLTPVEVREWTEVPVTGFTPDIPKYVMMPNWARPRHQAVLQRLEALRQYSETTPLNRIEWGDRQVGIVTSGISYQHAREALPGASIFKLGFSYPLPLEKLREFASQVERVIVVEELEPFIEEALKAHGIACEGKKYFPVYGELNPTLAARGLVQAGVRSEPVAETPAPVEVLPRPPVLCAGCGHRSIFYALRRMGAHVFGDIGCYTLSALPPLETVHACICMGASIGMAVGVSQTQGSKRPVFAVIGDSTFLHSGITGVLDAVYNQANVTIIILDNHITAMTGGQAHPATGMTLQGKPTKSVDFVALAKVLGADHVETIDPYDFNATWETLKASVARPGVNVLVTTRPCMLFPRKVKQEPYIIVAGDCNGCGVCLKIGCPAIARSGEVTDKNLAIPVIDTAACTGCRLCADICPQDCIILKSQPGRESEVKA